MTSAAPEVRPDPSPVPPEERFWRRYSPHHEFPLSTVARGRWRIPVAGGGYAESAKTAKMSRQNEQAAVP